MFGDMTRIILSDEADRMARQLAERTGLSLTDAITRALRTELDRTPDDAEDRAARIARIREIQKRVAAAPILEAGSDEELVYDADGLPR
ncbi:type II toxin-antitoxin system VapB family antitoxin [Caulobacter sp. ErkDOM-YI]|uniref:type II toxin-antitoxin system VapB family antitoxin n=1 Tax=unclassified Caulobacter TaxID=2648921 RepID=UPI003AF87B46